MVYPLIKLEQVRAEEAVWITNPWHREKFSFSDSKRKLSSVILKMHYHSNYKHNCVGSE